ncbi:MAG: LLM class flavin-dependent oxidoreductase [Alicyclobacillaceae bacterium]|nr:LLM class flavin-dependent oxidoreductase [Alicyclobacillaceae bacterium]
MRFAIWGANVAGGFLRSRADQEKRGSFAYNVELARLADLLGYHAMLYPVRFVGRIGGGVEDGREGQLDPLTTVAALSMVTERIHFISAVLPGFIHPATLAKIGATIDQISGGRWHVNLVSGWFREEQEMYGIPWLDHRERYERSKEYLQVLKGLWQDPDFSFEGRFYQIRGGHMRPFPLQKPYPSIFQGGNSAEARQMAGQYSDWYFMNGAPLEELSEQIRDVSREAARWGREVRFAVNAFVIARETEEEAWEEHRRLVEAADVEAIEAFRERAREAKGMWSRSTTLGDFVANNEGFRTGLIGSYEQVAERIDALHRIGIEMVLMAFRWPLQELPLFREKVWSALSTEPLTPSAASR